MKIKSDNQKIKDYINQGMDKNLDFGKELFGIFQENLVQVEKKPLQPNVAETMIETKNKSSHIKRKNKYNCIWL